jgi:hypothetical protein
VSVANPGVSVPAPAVAGRVATGDQRPVAVWRSMRTAWPPVPGRISPKITMSVPSR